MISEEHYELSLAFSQSYYRSEGVRFFPLKGEHDKSALEARLHELRL
jgi:hypothetical protein